MDNYPNHWNNLRLELIDDDEEEVIYIQKNKNITRDDKDVIHIKNKDEKNNLFCCFYRKR